MNRFSNKTVLITGGTTGIGLETAKAFAKEGAKVVVTGQNPQSIEEATKALGASAKVMRSDTASFDHIKKLASDVKQHFGHLDFLFINAGIAKFAPLETVTPEFFDETFSINVRGAFFTVQQMAPLMKSGTSIVLNTSVVDEMGMATATVYSASKAALRSLARTLAAELVGKGIRVNAVSPGPIETPIYGKMGMPKEHLNGFQAQMREMNPMKRFGQPAEVARAVLFLASEEASYTTGAELPVDGGFGSL